MNLIERPTVVLDNNSIVPLTSWTLVANQIRGWLLMRVTVITLKGDGHIFVDIRHRLELNLVIHKRPSLCHVESGVCSCTNGARIVPSWYIRDVTLFVYRMIARSRNDTRVTPRAETLKTHWTTSNHINVPIVIQWHTRMTQCAVLVLFIASHKSTESTRVTMPEFLVFVIIKEMTYITVITSHHLLTLDTSIWYWLHRTTIETSHLCHTESINRVTIIHTLVMTLTTDMKSVTTRCL